MADHRCLDDALTLEDWQEELVFAFGEVDIDSRIPKKYVVRIPSCKFVNPEKLCESLDKNLWQKGMVTVSSKADGAKGDVSMLRVQMHLVMQFYQLHVFDQHQPYEPVAMLQEMLGALVDTSRSISQLRNMPFLLRFPLADKLVKQKLGLPALIIMPGPSATELKGRLKDLAQRCLIICIGRSLQFCLDQGVHPDFVVQYDTHLEQKHFYDDIPQLPNTVLVALSSANISDYAHKFRGVFFRASFKLHFLPNDYVLRDSTEGSLLACMGVAEALAAPKTYLSGSDLSWPGASARYCAEADQGNEAHTQGDQDAAPEADWRLGMQKSTYLLPNRFGKTVLSTIGYVATAARAAVFAREIRKTTGTAFHVFNNSTILPEKEFPLVDIEDVLGKTPLDRPGYLNAVDTALQTSEKVDYTGLFTFLTDRLAFLQLQEYNFKLRHFDPNYDFELRKDLVALLHNVRSVTLNMSNSVHDRAAQQMTATWEKAFAHAAKTAMAHVVARAGGSVPLLCLPSEEPGIAQQYDSFFPKEHLKPLPILCSLTTAAKAPAHALSDNNLDMFIKNQKVMFITHAVQDKYNYFLSLKDADKFILLPPAHN